MRWPDIFFRARKRHESPQSAASLKPAKGSSGVPPDEAATTAIKPATRALGPIVLPGTPPPQAAPAETRSRPGTNAGRIVLRNSTDAGKHRAPPPPDPTGGAMTGPILTKAESAPITPSSASQPKSVHRRCPHRCRRTIPVIPSPLLRRPPRCRRLHLHQPGRLTSQKGIYQPPSLKPPLSCLQTTWPLQQKAIRRLLCRPFPPPP